MAIGKLTQCINECNRFVNRAMVLQDAIAKEEGKKYKSRLPKERGAVKRASLDLTRVLAELRATKL